MKIEMQFDCTQREVVADIARIISSGMGYRLPEDLLYLWRSRHPTEQGILRMAENIFEMFYGDSPDYSDESEE